MEEERRTPFTEEKVDINAELAEIDRQLAELKNSSPEQYMEKRKSFNLRPNVTRKSDEPIFLMPSKIKSIDRDLSKVIPSGIKALDKRIIGFNKRELSIWSGSNGAGKSSILSQLALEAINNRFKVALFSGELDADRVLNWLSLQAAGKSYTKPSNYEGYYTIPNDIKMKISTWLDDKLYIYNNNHGTQVIDVIKAIEDCIDEHKVDVLIMDNMMSLNLGASNAEKYDRQTDLVLRLSQLAKDKSVHIHLVSHPRKSVGFLRKTDISGTADITNAADNVFLAHRCNNDFKRNIKEFLGIKEDNPLLLYDNVIEVAKNRDLGVSDLFIGLYFEKESKRFLNVCNEIKRYGWEMDSQGFFSYINEKIPFTK